MLQSHHAVLLTTVAETASQQLPTSHGAQPANGASQNLLAPTSTTAATAFAAKLVSPFALETTLVSPFQFAAQPPATDAVTATLFFPTTPGAPQPTTALSRTLHVHSTMTVAVIACARLAKSGASLS